MRASTIGWTDFSGGPLNFISGCTPVSAGCKNCYARAIAERFGRSFDVTTHSDKLEKLATMRLPEYSPKRGAPHKPMAFVCDTGDLFHEDVPDWFIYDALRQMGSSDNVTWQVLTKRAKRMHDLLGKAEPRRLWIEHAPNIWLGVTAENQATADERIPLLLDTPAAVRFVSVEPMLEPLQLIQWLWNDEPLSWVIAGAESGPNRRSFDVRWALDLYDQCAAGGVAYFGKQDSSVYPGNPLVLPGYGEVKQWPG